MIRINDKLFFQYEKIMLENGMPQDLIFKTFKELAETNMFFNYQQQLQSYKQKEDKLRELSIKRIESCNATIGNPDHTIISKTELLLNEIKVHKTILQILNEGE